MSLKDRFLESLKGISTTEITLTSWSKPEISNALNQALENKSTQIGEAESLKRKDDLLRDLLSDVVRPTFSKNRNKHVTEQGRKAMEAWQPAIPYDSEAIRATKPWRYEDAWVVDVFSWILDTLKESTVEGHWPMLIPPILAHIDDDVNGSRVRGCELLRKLLKINPTDLLKRTGLGEVFEEALLPQLLHIPPAFDEAESISMLDAAYPTILLLIQTRFPEKGAYVEGKQKSLDRVMRQGILTGLAQSQDEVVVSRHLLRHMAPLLTELGILCVKHLKTMLPLVSVRLTNPFATAAPELMADAATALRAILLNAWPRVANWRLEILEALIVSWLRIASEDRVTTSLEDVKKAICRNVMILRDILSDCDGGEAVVQVKRVLQSDHGLQGLLEIWEKEPVHEQ